MDFKEQIFELAFGDDAINAGYSEQDVLRRLTAMSNELYCFMESLRQRPEIVFSLEELEELEETITDWTNEEAA